jgi:UDP-N-acetylmuramoyl-tripeptide--D-alanyl-D-alanine ligase
VLTAAIVAAAAGGTALSEGGQVFGRFSIDSRTLQPGEAFIALKGERFDGAAYAEAVLDRGASGVVIHRSAGLGASLADRWPSAAVVEVDDSLETLQRLARYVRRESGARVVAITGSAGKTTTKELAATLLAARYRVFRNAGNLNNHVGLPLSLLELVSRPDMAVVELGMNHHGEIRQLVAIAEPDVRVWTNVGDAHLGHFESADDLAKAKAEILEGPPPLSLVVANRDDARVMRHVEAFPGRVTTFGLSEQADVRAADVEDAGTLGTRARLETRAGAVDVEVPLVGLGNLLNVLAATAVALEYDVPLKAVAETVRSVKPARHRGEVVRLREGVTLVDDSYNSSPSALGRALDAIARDRGHRRRVAVLGEMLELGDFSMALHQQCGRTVAAAGVDVLVAVGGPPAAQLAAAARAAGLEKGSVHYVATSAEAADLVAQTVAAGDLVLVKGSRGIKTDVVAERVIAEWS